VELNCRTSPCSSISTTTAARERTSISKSTARLPDEVSFTGPAHTARLGPVFCLRITDQRLDLGPRFEPTQLCDLRGWPTYFMPLIRSFGQSSGPSRKCARFGPTPMGIGCESPPGSQRHVGRDHHPARGATLSLHAVRAPPAPRRHHGDPVDLRSPVLIPL
jgi:hypothetical protein